MMDRHTCKLCFRRFANGRALGGHMRSHVTYGSARAGGKTTQLWGAGSPSSSASASREAPEEVAFQVADQAAAAAASMAGREATEPVEETKQLAYYGLRENPRKSFRLVDPEFSSTFPAAAAGVAGGGCSSVVLLDRESETESSKPSSLRRRSKRRRRVSPLPVVKSEPSVEPEPVSSVSDATPEEDVARCLMMLSRDAWGGSSPSPAGAAKRKRSCSGEEEEEEQNSDDESEEELTTVVRSRKRGRSRYQCETCRKVFRSYQALGGHRASHKKVKPCTVPPPPPRAATPAVEEEDDERKHPHLHNPIQDDADSEVNAAPSTGSTDRRIHECPVCFRIFGSGQALGGHKRSHAVETSPAAAAATAALSTAADATTASAAASAVSPMDAGRTESFIDLNLPPPMEEEAETSAICDGDH